MHGESIIRSYLALSLAPGPMAKPRRGVQFQHRGSVHQNGRRPSVSESDGVSEPGSPAGAAMNGRLGTSKEDVEEVSTTWLEIQQSRALR